MAKQLQSTLAQQLESKLEEMQEDALEMHKEAENDFSDTLEEHNRELELSRDDMHLGMACDVETKRDEFQEQLRRTTDGAESALQERADKVCDAAIDRFDKHVGMSMSKLQQGREKLKQDRKKLEEEKAALRGTMEREEKRAE
jgi:F0F1-type ATP synthase membrane subunit b/b'